MTTTLSRELDKIRDQRLATEVGQAIAKVEAATAQLRNAKDALARLLDDLHAALRSGNN